MSGVPSPVSVIPEGESQSGRSVVIPKKRQAVVVGCTARARAIVSAIEAAGNFSIVGFLKTNERPPTEVLGYPVIGAEEDLPSLLSAGVCDAAVVAVPDNWARQRTVNCLTQLAPNVEFLVVIDPSATVAEDVVIGRGTVILAAAVVDAASRVGDFCFLNTSSKLRRRSIMGDFSSLAPHVTASDGVIIGRLSAIGERAVVSSNIHIGEATVVNAGATVLENLPSNVVASGTPAQVIRPRHLAETDASERKSSMREPTLARQSTAFVLGDLRLIPAGSPEWAKYLEPIPHDFFHTAGAHELHEVFGTGKAWLAVYSKGEKRALWPYLIRDIDSTEEFSDHILRDVTSVYGHTGPLTCAPEHDTEFFNAAWNEMVKAWREQSVVSVFTRFNPFLSNHRWLRDVKVNGQAPVRGGPVPTGKTVAIDLAKSQAEIWSSYTRQLRQALRRCEEAHMSAEWDPDWKYLDDFIRLYYTTMKRNNAALFYYFPAQYFRKLKEVAGAHAGLLVTRYLDQIVSAALLIEYDGTVNVHLLASDERFSHLSPSKFTLHRAQAEAQARSHSLLHLGGGRGSRDDDPLFRFKAQFSRQFYCFVTGRWVLDESAYELLCEERRKRAASLGKVQLDANYFPFYRAALR